VRNRSIGFRLAAWYSLVLACGMAAFSLAAWWAMRASVYHAIDDELRDRVRGVQKFMAQQISALSLPEIRDEFREHSVLGPGGDLFQVCDAQGQWLYRSVPLENNNVPIEPPASLRKPRFATAEIASRPLRFYSERIVVSGQPYTVQVAASMHEAFEAIEAFGILLAFAVPVLLVSASAGGYWISKRALDPVDGISRAAQQISIENLADRLPVPQTGDQLQRLTQTLNQMFSRLEASVRQMKQFTADASHELRAPIALIRTTAEVAVQRRNRPPQEYLEALDDILEESEQMSQVVNSLLLLARADAGKEHLEFAVIDAGAVVRGAADQGGKLARQKGIDFAVSLPEVLCRFERMARHCAVRYSFCSIMPSSTRLLTDSCGSACRQRMASPRCRCKTRGSALNWKACRMCLIVSGERIKHVPGKAAGLVWGSRLPNGLPINMAPPWLCTVSSGKDRPFSCAFPCGRKSNQSPVNGRWCRSSLIGKAAISDSAMIAEIPFPSVIPQIGPVG
jgi:signal transduction histidine kinase